MFYTYTKDIEIPESGFIIDMPEEAYFKVDALSYSSSKEFMKSPAHYKAYLTKEHKLDAEREFFKAVHLLTLEDPSAANRVVVKDGVWSGKLKEEVLYLKAQGYLVVKQEAFDTAKAVSEAIKTNPVSSKALKNGYGEISMFWTDPHSGVRCKGRIDALLIDDKEAVIYDLKNFSGLHDEELMGKQVANLKYHYQMAFYSLGINSIFKGEKTISCKWIFCEDDKPYGVKVRKCPVELLDKAYLHYQEILFPYFDHCTKNNEWPCFEEEERDLFVLPWLMKGKENE